MTARGASGSVLGTQFDEFLFAPAFEEKSGPLSVLSALARLDVDPWQTAAALAQLPRLAAAKQLASMLAGLPDGSADRDAIAARVVALLPSQAGTRALPPGGTPPEGRQVLDQHLNLVFMYIIFILVWLLVESLVLSRQAGSAAHVNQAPAIGAAAVVSP